MLQRVRLQLTLASPTFPMPVLQVQETPYWQGYWLDAIRNLSRDSKPSDYWGHQVGSCASKQASKPSHHCPKELFSTKQKNASEPFNSWGKKKRIYWRETRSNFGRFCSNNTSCQHLPASSTSIVISRFLETSTKKSQTEFNRPC